MAIVASATPTLRMAYTLTDTTTERAISESATVGISAQAFSDYTSGTGYAEINAGVVLTGVLGSGSGFNISTTGVFQNPLMWDCLRLLLKMAQVIIRLTWVSLTMEIYHLGSLSYII